MNILLVEDDPSISEPLVRGLQREGFNVALAENGESALGDHEISQLDLVLLDVGLPGIDGFEVCRRIRAQSGVPVIFLTAHGEEIDKILGFELGADDYVVKPFGLRELAARIRAVSRRVTTADSLPNGDRREFSNIELDIRTHSVRVDGEEVTLTKKEFELLELLSSDVGATFTREQILRDVWDEHWFGSSKTLDVHISSLRKKLNNPDLIETVRGVGFRLSVR